MSMSQWHLIYDQPASGPRNMAVDEALLDGLENGVHGPVLRFYRWELPVLSLGYGQSAADADHDRLRAYGWGVVRRSTGGKAILHTDELTYSLVLPLRDPLAEGGIVESYRRISGALLGGLALLGIQTHADRRANGAAINGPICFEVPSHYEIVTMDGRKLIGSAQRRRERVLLQHGTLPLYGDVGRIVDALAYENAIAREEARGQVRARAATLADALGKALAWETVAEVMSRAFAEHLAVDWLPPVSPDEGRVAQLIREKYAADAWTWRR